MSEAVPAVRMRGITRRFGETVALDGVEFDLRPGEIHALLGENGAGKSTLMHLLAGALSPDAGTIEVNGQPVRFRSAREAARAGIGMVHQHFTLVENFTVAENLALALPSRTPLLLPRRGLAAEPLALAERLGWNLEPGTPVWQLPVGAQQRLEILKALARDPRILIFDEPTAVLAPVELEELFRVLQQLRDEGRSLVFISHKLNEVLSLSDRITVLRRGRNAGTLLPAETDPGDLARRMVGGGLPGDLEEARALMGPQLVPGMKPPGELVLRLFNLRVHDDRGLEAVRDLSLELRAGEILGLAGVDGNGQAELAEAILRLREPYGGGIDYSGAPTYAGAPPRRAVGYIPQDRRRAGLVPGMSVRDNLILELHLEPESRHGAWLRWRFLNEEAARLAREYDIRTAGLEQDAGTLSGGNQQKIVIARALQKKPRLLVAVNPTRGVDVGATGFVHDRLREERERGAGILLISTELDEVIGLSDRIGVLYGGELMGIVPPETPRERLGLMMGGQRAEGYEPFS